MPPAEDVQRGLFGAWRLMMGDRDGMRHMDISVDGFWNSFFAVIVAFPALVIGWLAAADRIAELGLGAEVEIGRGGLLARLAVVEIGVWLLPLAAYMLVARYVGLSDRIVHLVVACNWGEALGRWLVLPVALLLMVWRPERETEDAVRLIVFLAVAVLNWRLTNAALGKGPAIASAVFGGLFIGSLLVLLALEGMLGLLAFEQL